MKVTHEITYLLNYKPLLNFKKELKNLNTIYCKNFFLFFLLLENLVNKGKKGAKTNNVSIFIKKKNKYQKSFLRAPNKYKKAQVKIELIRYEVTFKFSFNYNLEFVNKLNIRYLLYFINFFFSFFLFFESTLFFLKKKKFNIKLDDKCLLTLFEL